MGAVGEQSCTHLRQANGYQWLSHHSFLHWGNWYGSFHDIVYRALGYLVLDESSATKGTLIHQCSYSGTLIRHRHLVPIDSIGCALCNMSYWHDLQVPSGSIATRVVDTMISSASAQLGLAASQPPNLTFLPINCNLCNSGSTH